jgi:hypothetical protein
MNACERHLTRSKWAEHHFGLAAQCILRLQTKFRDVASSFNK